MKYHGHDLDKIATAYPRLMRSLQWVGILSRNEAACVIRNIRAGYTSAGEAVTHYAGYGHQDDPNRYIAGRAIKARNRARFNNRVPGHWPHGTGHADARRQDQDRRATALMDLIREATGGV